MTQEFNKQQGQNQTGTGAGKSNVTPARPDQGSSRSGDMARERDLDRSQSDRSSTSDRERI